MLREIASAVARHDVSARELIERALARVDALDGELGAVVARRDDLALAEADELDRRLAAGEDPGPLAGVPFLVKDLEDLAGLPTTFGSLLFADAPPAERDGLVPRRLRTAGAIPIGKTNLPEFATEGFTANLLFGATANPWAPAWSPGGSSGGSAAAIAAGMVPIATGTDGGGSLRIPAAFCGLVGLKPTNGIVGRDPIPSWIDLSTDGPMASTIDDLELLLSIEAGPVEGDPTALPAWRPGPGGPPGRLLALPRWHPWGPLPEVVASAFEAALADAERTFGLPVERLEPEELFGGGNPDLDWFAIATAEHVGELGRAFVVEHLERMHPAARAFFEQGLATTVDDHVAARRRRFGYVRDLDVLLGEDAVLLMPTVASEGWSPEGVLPHATPGEAALPAEVYNTVGQNLTGHPAISLPTGVLPNGVPFGLQATAPRFRDDLLLAFGRTWEAERSWPGTAPGYEPFWPTT